MILLRLSGHSGAGKSRLLKEVEHRGVTVGAVALFNTRTPRPSEVDGGDYHFVTREQIQQLPVDSYYVGPVREMLQAVDLVKLEEDLRTRELVVIEVSHKLWPGLEQALRQRLGDCLRTVSVFICAVDLERIETLEEREARGEIEEEVKAILTWRRTEDNVAIARRARSAACEVLGALTGAQRYNRIFRTSPEGPDGEDDWTFPGGPRGNAARAAEEFVAFIEALRRGSGLNPA